MPAATVPPPQEDFYQHVNAKWMNDPENAIPGEYSQWGGFTKLHDEGLKKQIALIETLKAKGSAATEEEQKIAAIWHASMEMRFAAWEAGKGDLAEMVAELKELDAHLPESLADADDAAYVRAVAKYFWYTQKNGIRNVFDLDKGSDLKQVNNVVLDLSPCGLSLPSREYYTEANFEEKRGLFKAHLENVQRLVAAGGYDLGAGFVGDVTAFEDRIAACAMKREHSRDYHRYYTNTTLSALAGREVNDLAYVEEKDEYYADGDRKCALGDAELALSAAFWEQVYAEAGLKDRLAANLAKNFTEKGVANPPDVHHVTAFDGDGIRRTLRILFDKKRLPQYRAFLRYKVVTRLSGFCTKALDEEFFDYFSRKLNGQAEQKSHEKRSIATVNAYAGEMNGKVFVAHYFSPKAKDTVKGMINEVLAVMKRSLEENDWLTAATKAKALEKLTKFRVKIGYPDVWKDYTAFTPEMGDTLYQISRKMRAWKLETEFYGKINSELDREEWHMTPQTVNAYFMPTQNEIVFPAAILQEPFFFAGNAALDFDVAEERAAAAGLDAAQAANFGGIGAVIAHEITHGYDDKGRRFDGDGNLNDWWNDEDVALFEKKTAVMAEHAKTYLFVDAEDGGKEYRMNPQLCMGENLADLGGLSLSLQALKHRLAGAGASPEAVAASLRVAFKSWGNVWKCNIKKDSRINRLTTDPHAPADFRGNLLAMIPDFYTCFGVKEGDKMYIPPEGRVHMW
eukprot:TRINITY_DN11531_c0_g1_i2.p1 TRINITY_DN11531_c0_g1~~TRINITY_DN11531_c0_g1_i2.p1  ORF type:complete len:738 (+),score=355.78 TRINITY_DN11531_c0_g1_i2:61-2274(+)